jgi:hypothetical protein
MKRILWLILRTLLIAAVALYLIDWAVVRIRAVRGTAYGSVQVNEYLSTALKGNKAEYDYLGTTAQPCVHAIFKHDALQPCWWVERHKDLWE